MNDFGNLEKTIVRELSCRMCLCNDVVKLKPLSSEIKRKLKKLFDIVVRADDNLPKAICHECLQQVAAMHLYTVKVEKTQKFLDFHKAKSGEPHRDQKDHKPSPERNVPLHPIGATRSMQNLVQDDDRKKPNTPNPKTTQSDLTQGDSKPPKTKSGKKRISLEMKYMEAMPLEEFAKTEKVDKSLLNGSMNNLTAPNKLPPEKKEASKKDEDEVHDSLDPVVLIDGRPAKQGAALDKQITLFYKMECCICHENGFHFRSLMKHYKDRHGVPGYVTCCDKKFHYFYPKKIIEHMAYHLQPHIFMCPSCHQNFQTSQELQEHQSNGGRSEGKIFCPRCNDRFPTYHELGQHIITHRSAEKNRECDYCGKQLKHHHRKKTINHMEDVILCSQCIRTLKNIERHEKEAKEKSKNSSHDAATLQKHQKFRQAMGISGDEDGSTD